MKPMKEQYISYIIWGSILVVAILSVGFWSTLNYGIIFLQIILILGILGAFLRKLLMRNKSFRDWLEEGRKKGTDNDDKT